MRIPTCRFHLHVFTDHVKSEVFGFLNIINQRFVCRSCIQSVGPPSLIERTELEHIFIVQLQTYNSVLVTACRVFAHSCIAIYFIGHFTIAQQGNLHRIKSRRSRTPQFGISRHLNVNSLAVQSFSGSNQLVTIENLYLDNFRRTAGTGSNVHCEFLTVDVRSRTNISNMTFGHRLHPDSLPDTGNSRIPDAFRTVYLFATRLRSAICRVPYLHNKFIVSFSSQSSRNIE